MRASDPARPYAEQGHDAVRRAFEEPLLGRVLERLLPAALGRLVTEIASHGRPGALVALEALGLRSLEWPGLWYAPAGAARMLPYRLADDVSVHPWAPDELFVLLDHAGIEPLRAVDRTLQCPPKAGERRYWPGMPALRPALNALLDGGDAAPALAAPLPPLPAGDAALVHHALAARRRALLDGASARGAPLARCIWALEPATAGGYGHGLLVIGRVR